MTGEMPGREAQFVSLADGAGDWDGLVALLPPRPAVFLLFPRDGQPYLGRTASLRRRMARLLGRREQPSRLLNLRDAAVRLDYWLTASRLESALLTYRLGRLHFPDSYQHLLHIPRPSYIKLILSNPFPRVQVTSRLSGGRSRYFGPFRSRAAAEDFEKQFLDLFQIRRCPEDMEPSPEHPGCIYGEMRMCLRPCQAAVSIAEYSSEAARVRDFLSTRASLMLEASASARNRLSEELRFEEAAREHARHERIQQVIRQSGELARDLDRLDGVAVQPSVEAATVNLWFLLAGCWQDCHAFYVGPTSGKPVPLDQRLRLIVEGLERRALPAAQRQEHLGLLARWYFSTWRDGEWLPFDDPAAIPYRKLVHAIHRVASAGEQASLFSS